MREMPSIQLVKTWYIKSFHELRNAPTPNTVAKEADLAVLLKNIYERHAPVLLTMARGAYELRQKYVAGSSEFYDLEVHNFLDAFYLSRIGIRMLIGQYLGEWLGREGGREGGREEGRSGWVRGLRSS